VTEETDAGRLLPGEMVESTLKRKLSPGCVALGARLDRIRFEWFYLVVALVWGVAIVVVVPPFQSPDEPAHYLRAWSVANLQLVSSPDQTVTVPENVASLPDRIGSAMIDWRTNLYSPRLARSLLWERISLRRQEQYTSASGAGPVGYLPPAVGIAVARGIQHSPLLGFYLGRACNLLASVIIVFFAIRLLPFGKPLMVLVGLFPMTISQMASLSPDGLALSGALMFVALVLSRAQKEAVTTRDVVWLGLAATVLLNAKVGYAVLAMLVFVLAPRQLGGFKRYATCTGFVLAAAFAVAGALFLTAPAASTASLAKLGVTGVDPAGQLSFVTHHPYAFLKVLYATFETYATPLAQQTYGVLGWLQVGLPYVGMLLVGLAVVLFLGQTESVGLVAWQRFVIILTGAAFAAEIGLALYMSWSAVASPVVVGLQGRYFIPVTLLVLLGIYGVRLRTQRAAILLMIGVVAIVILTTLRALVKFYY